MPDKVFGTGAASYVNVCFLVPDIHDLQTGGNVFNRRMVDGLRPETTVRVTPWAPAETPASELDLEESDAIIADSLLAQHPGALRALKEKHPAASLILMVHYLRCVDPSKNDGDGAANERATLGVVDAAITTSHFVRRTLVEEGLPADRIGVVRPGLDERYRGPLPSRLGRGTPHLLTVANLLPEKGLHSFVDVLRGLRGLPWRWTLVGDASLDPEYAADIFRRLRAMGLADCVTWTGPVSPEILRTWYDRADVFGLPSRFETCSLSTREAMARGLPVVGYRVGGLPENFDDAPAGHLVPPGNRGAFRAALESLLTDPMAQGRRGVAAWQRSRGFPTWTEAAEQFRKRLAALHARVAGAT